MGKPRKGHHTKGGGRTQDRARERQNKFSEDRFTQDLDEALRGCHYYTNDFIL